MRPLPFLEVSGAIIWSAFVLIAGSEFAIGIGFIVIFCFFINITIDLLIKLKKIIINKNYQLKQSYYLNLGVFLIFFPFQPNGNLFNNYMLVNLSIIIVFYLYDKKLNE